MDRTPRFLLPTILLAAMLGLSACADVNEDTAGAAPVQFAAPATITTTQPVLANLTPPSLNLGAETDASPVDDTPTVVRAGKHLYCVEFARERSGMSLSGNAAAWWKHAAGKYARSDRPTAGAVMVFSSTRRMRSGHLAVVRRVVSNREIRIDHSNWMNDGRIYLNVSVVDVSPNNDWSKVRVWNQLGGGQIGTRVYPISGFVSKRDTASAE